MQTNRAHKSLIGTAGSKRVAGGGYKNQECNGSYGATKLQVSRTLVSFTWNFKKNLDIQIDVEDSRTILQIYCASVFFLFSALF